MQQDVGTIPMDITAFIGRVRPVIQNLGPGDLYVDTDTEASIEGSIKIAVGVIWEFQAAIGEGDTLSLVATQEDTDVRLMGMGGRAKPGSI